MQLQIKETLDPWVLATGKHSRNNSDNLRLVVLPTVSTTVAVNGRPVNVVVADGEFALVTGAVIPPHQRGSGGEGGEDSNSGDVSGDHFQCSGGCVG